jgi:hypothetical protein
MARRTLHRTHPLEGGQTMPSAAEVEHAIEALRGKLKLLKDSL